jgi:hypothetical protein
MTNYEKTHHLLHVLWTRAVGTKDYDKKQWQELETSIRNLIKPDFDDANTPPVEPFHAQRERTRLICDIVTDLFPRQGIK